MNIRQAIFASVASAGVLASGWLGGTAPAAPSASAPTTHRLGSAPTGTSTATQRLAPASAALTTVRRGQLRGTEPVQLLSGPGYTAAAYDLTQQAALDTSLA
ncbi:hypothetical protein JTF08_14100 [Micrococcaceae bacterium RIT802]|nr:hypothetical protein [Micrococcaceae bacterium RIT 802]